MHKVNISPPLSLARFFLTQQPICGSKIEKRNVSLDIFVSDNSLARKHHLPGLEKKHFSYIRDCRQITFVITLNGFCPLSNPPTPLFLMDKTKLDMESEAKLNEKYMLDYIVFQVLKVLL